MPRSPQRSLCFSPLLGCLLLVLGFAHLNGVAWGQGFTEPVVARIQMRIQQGEDFVDVIHKGDLLTVLEEREDAYLVLTPGGNRGLVGKINAFKLVESVEIYDALIKDSPKVGRFFTLRASAWFARGDHRRALADYDRAIELGYKEPHAYSSRGMFHASAENYDKAIADFTTAIKLTNASKSPEAEKDDTPYLNRAATYMAVEKYALAVKDYDEAVRRRPKKASTYQQRAFAFKADGKLKQAIDDYAKCIELEPKNKSAWMGRGYAWLQMKDTKKAIADFSKVIEIDANFAYAYSSRGYSRQQQSDIQGALADYDEAIRLDAGQMLAYQNKAWLLVTAEDDKVRDGKSAVIAATKACELNNFSDFESVRTLAAAFAEDREFQKAIGWQEKAVKLAPKEQRDEEAAVLEQYQDRKTRREKTKPGV